MHTETAGEENFLEVLVLLEPSGTPEEKSKSFTPVETTENAGGDDEQLPRSFAVISTRSFCWMLAQVEGGGGGSKGREELDLSLAQA